LALREQPAEAQVEVRREEELRDRAADWLLHEAHVVHWLEDEEEPDGRTREADQRAHVVALLLLAHSLLRLFPEDVDHGVAAPKALPTQEVARRPCARRRSARDATLAREGSAHETAKKHRAGHSPHGRATRRHKREARAN